ncbi:tRNA uridine-5-carboxymethylaminomethyl(34) synthesis GTPase MnmE [Sphingomonas sp. CL5.1]|uniref:tRNA uridine-5-carboxymethylaminomethyl(34) synthesis GTPase MnmE n=1 Tax=Sphingomonas sp. CL5.1 TaxID=2653203 RepID=UPI001582808B|nr:tRNA uridine-5-carboxymethylaminomethyl(34) synthesis GTPase MnmE [Sphingomonas sp. CL5.1]QKR99102.1 tRNA uridine-5-carboxymethylaminomethyl(34) synthesis GTPase MnmE [Sphingomonas sp. CL5.1]
MDTIFAVSSGQPPAAIAVLRMSGPRARDAVEALAGALPEPRRAVLRRLWDGDGALLDDCLLLWFPGPSSATGEDLAEFHLHGGIATVAAVERALAAQPGLRRARGGEFTRRALENGRIDLAQAQGLADLLEAETEAQRRAAIASVDGEVSRAVARWLTTLAGIAARIEAMIDFSDEDDVEPADTAALDAAIRAWLADLDIILERPTVERLREGCRIVLAGSPNVGKSSLFNAMIEREAAIVTPIAGTTRDLLETRVVRNGRLYTLIDTAGLASDTDDPVERIGIERARRAADTADIVLWLDDSAPPAEWPVLALHPRCDMAERLITPTDRLPISRDDLRSIDHLWGAIEQRAGSLLTTDGAALREQQRNAVIAARASMATDGMADDLLVRAEGVRYAMRQLAGIVGADATETMLDALFARFCIGK